jgi:16S rRNA (cytosine1402-N4)-methyltransferase
MNEIYHIPAMLRETIQGLNIQPNGLYVDVTFGGGGHSRAILEELESGVACRDSEFGSRESRVGKLYSFDQDMDAYDNAMRSDFGNLESGCQHWQFVHSNFRYLRNFMDYYGVEQIDGLLGDLGVSFHHFDCPERGFSFRFSAPLDMRMNQTGGNTAADVLNTYSEEDLARVLYMYGEMNNSRQIAKKIVKARSQKAIERTEELVDLAIGNGRWAIGDGGEIEVPTAAKKDLAKLFQALRIEVNDEMGALREMLLAAKDLLKPGGRIAILTYHSLEDRIVKNFLRSGNLEGKIEKDFYGNILSPFKVIEKGATASADEVERNPRARSAKLRVAEKL